MPLGQSRSALEPLEEEPDEREQGVVAAELDGEPLLVLGVRAEDPGGGEALTVDGIDLVLLVEQVVH